MSQSKVSRVTVGSAGNKPGVKEDLLVVEEPLEIRVNYGPSNERKEISISVTMRTPGNDFELAIGFFCTQRVLFVLMKIS